VLGGFVSVSNWPQSASNQAVRSNVLIIEDILYLQAKQTSNPKRKGQAGIEFPRLDCIHCLAGHVQVCGQILLRPGTLCT
jgi:hypothetical protein